MGRKLLVFAVAGVACAAPDPAQSGSDEGATTSVGDGDGDGDGDTDSETDTDGHTQPDPPFAEPCVVWKAQFGSAAWDVGEAIGVAHDGSVFVTGRSDGDIPGGEDEDTPGGFLAKLSADGELEWVQNLDGEHSLILEGLVVDGDTVYIAGYTPQLPDFENAGNRQLAMLSFDLGGNLNWAIQEGPMYGEVRVYDIALTPDGNLVVVGESMNDFLEVPTSGDGHHFVAAFTPDAEHVWFSRFGDGDYRDIEAVAAGPTGAVFAIGETEHEGTEGVDDNHTDAEVFKFDEDGVFEWSVRLDNNEWDHGFDLAPDAVGGVYATGDSKRLEPGDGGPHLWSAGMLVAHLDAEGSVEWLTGTHYLLGDWDPGIRLGPGGQVYTTQKWGSADPDLGSDVSVAEFSPEGELLWVRVTEAVGGQNPNALAVGPGGDLYVTGWTEGEFAGPEYGSKDVIVARLCVQ